jgi:hypothetical protein
MGAVYLRVEGFFFAFLIIQNNVRLSNDLRETGKYTRGSDNGVYGDNVEITTITKNQSVYRR